MLLQITYKQLCFGIEITGNKVTAAAPCARWQMGKSVSAVLNYWFRRGATIKKLHEL